VRRAWQTWAVFGTCLVLVLLAVGWVTRITLRLEQSQAETRRQADTEEAIRLALWRMDSGLATLIARESARPYFTYSPLYPAAGAYASMFAPSNAGDELIPSPLLIQNPPYVLLHFQLHPDGRFSSPQVPTGAERRLAQDHFTTRERVAKGEALLAQLAPRLTRQVLDALPRDTLWAPSPPAVTWPRSRAPESSIVDNKSALIEKKDANIDWKMRAKNARQVMAQNVFSNQAGELPVRGPDSGPGGQSAAGAESGSAQAMAPGPGVEPANAVAAAPHNGVLTASDGDAGWVTEGAMTPLAVGDLLLLARRVSVNGAEYIQGCWLDWPAIEGWLLPAVRDLLPDADLELVAPGAGNGGEHLLASLPVKLIPGSSPPPSEPALTPVRVSLLIVWGCLALAGLASALLLLGTITLGERRAAFTSAVTHELRTPLTTFRLYAEMLAGGMVIGEEKRREYLDTLSKEAERLSHLVENVLAYARLEKNSSGGRRETVGLQDLMERATARLRERAERAGMSLVVEAEDEVLSRSVVTDVSAIEQILFNLVDNACKYASGAQDKRIHVEAAAAGRRVLLRVRDHGPGIAAPEARRLFRPFSKSAREAANASVPGVGLGLALSRRLARRMRGELSLDKHTFDGACFVLAIPSSLPESIPSTTSADG
jgi:signal transduction histidine kinase